MQYQLETVRDPGTDRHAGTVRLRLKPGLLKFWFSHPPVKQRTYINGIWAFRGDDGSYVELYDWCPTVHGEEFWNLDHAHDYYVDGDGDLAPFIDWLRLKCGAMIISLVEPQLEKYKEHLERSEFEEALNNVSLARYELPEEPRIFSKDEFERLFDLPLPKRTYSMSDEDVLETTRSLVSFFENKRCWPVIVKENPDLAKINLANYFTSIARLVEARYDDLKCMVLELKDKLHEAETILRLNKLHDVNESVKVAVKNAFILQSQMSTAIAAQLERMNTFFAIDAINANLERTDVAWLAKRADSIKDECATLQSATNLKLLYICDNELGKCAGFEFPNLPKLIAVDLDNNSLSELPAGLTKCSNLQFISLRHNELKDFNVDLATFTQLKCVDLSFNPISLEQSRKIKEQHPNVFFIFLPLDELYDAYSAAEGKPAQDRLAIIDKLYEMAPENFDIVQSRGTILDELGRYEEALVCHKRLIDIKPTDDTGYYNSACCFALQGKADEACDYLVQSLDYCSDNLKYAAEDSAFDTIRDTQRFKDLF